MENVVLSIDCGTQSLRALIFSVDGELLEKVQIKYKPYVSPKPGWAEQDPETYWTSLCQACQQLKEKTPHLFSHIAGVGVTTLRDSHVNVNKEGTPLRPVITWLDQRKARPVFSPPWLLHQLFRIIGVSEALYKTQTDGKCNWIMQNQPEIWEKTHKYLQISGFLNFRLTGEFKDSIASQIGHIPFNYKKMRWSSKWELGSLLFPVEKSKLPLTVAPGKVIGKITRKASTLTGIREGLPVIACGSDKGCETIGMGVLGKKMASLSFGTTATVQTTSRRYFEPLKFMPAYPAPIPGHYNPEVEIFRGFWMITWFQNEFAHQEMIQAQERGISPEAVLNELLVQAPPGSMGLVVQPFWGPGLKTPEAKGAMIGFGDVHTKAHIYRSVIEGLGFALLDGLKNLENRGGVAVEKVTVSGGASQSDGICQIAADIFNRPLLRGRTFETSGLGAAIVTSFGLGIHSSFETAMDTMVKYDREFSPNPQNVSIYTNLYHRVYKKLYQSLKPLYEEIREITGYPEK